MQKIRGEAEKEYVHPFYHMMIDGFLLPKELSTIADLYDSTPQHFKVSDLFRFYQSEELRNKKEYFWFLEKVKTKMLEISEKLGKDIVSPEMDLFTSCYFEDHFLLPHDDCLDERVFAFSFYLETMEEVENEERNGALALYEEDGLTLSKRIPVVGNRLVIFEVSGKSFHEVEKCLGQRRALTGWMRSKGYSPQSNILPYRENRYLFMDLSIAIFLEKRLIQSEKIEVFVKEDYDGLLQALNSIKWKPRLNLLSCKVFEPEESKQDEYTFLPFTMPLVYGRLVDTLVLKIEKDGYLLLNDPFNCESDILVVVSLFNGTVIITRKSKESKDPSAIRIEEEEEDVPLDTITKKQRDNRITGIVYPQPNRKMLILPTKETGYVIAYRINFINGPEDVFRERTSTSI